MYVSYHIVSLSYHTLFTDKEGGGHHCDCDYGYYGKLCQHSSLGFLEDSFLQLPPLDSQSNIIQMTVSTNQRDALLLFQPGTDTDFIALQIVNGSAVFNFDVGGKVYGLIVAKVSD